MSSIDDLTLAIAYETELSYDLEERSARAPRRLKEHAWWWANNAHTASVSDFRSKFRMWPETLCELVSRLTGKDYRISPRSSWLACLATNEAKYIAHAACLLIHGMWHMYFAAAGTPRL